MSDSVACKCGSRLPQTKCCDLDTTATQAAAFSCDVSIFLEQIETAICEKNLVLAELLLSKILMVHPTEVNALGMLARIRHEQGCALASETLLARSVRLQPNHIERTHQLALILMRKGALQQAERHARNGVRLAPDHPQSHNILAIILTEGNRARPGEYHYRRVLELAGTRDPIVLANLAWNLKSQGRAAEARLLYKESWATAPDVLQTLVGWALLEEADRQFGRADELLCAAEALAPDDPAVQLSRAVLCGRTRDYIGALRTLRQVEKKNGGSLGPRELLEKGRLLEKMGDYDAAFQAYRNAKRVARELTGFVYLETEARNLVERLTSFFVKHRLALMPVTSPSPGMEQPVFILGFPRSGTTLVEQILSSHPQITAGDEMPLITDISKLLPQLLNSPLVYPEALAELWMGDQRDSLDLLRDFYLQRARTLGIGKPGNGWFTDKMPLNETNLGLIALMFPKSPLIHVIRHPLDVVLSTFSTYLTHGFYCAFDLQSIVVHYMMIFGLVKHYRAEVNLKYLIVKYEDIVHDQDATIRKMISFIGEEFDQKCMRFHENPRHARTPSYAQVTEKLYGASCYRYRHYREQLECLVPLLQPAITEFGYEVSWDSDNLSS